MVSIERACAGGSRQPSPLTHPHLPALIRYTIWMHKSTHTHTHTTHHLGNDVIKFGFIRYKALLGRIDERKKVRFEEAKKKVEEEEEAERQARLGPAGLDPFEVLEQIPPKMKEAFETQNTPLLKAEFAALPDGEREEVYRKVVGSGLWVPAPEDGDGAGAAE